MFHCIKHYMVGLVHIVHNAYKMHYALCMEHIENQMHRTVTQYNKMLVPRCKCKFYLSFSLIKVKC